ncbi:EAL domain-containing protein [Couchioplanes caeruleus]|uniref:EAL domain-containing protein n=1 Tax=Couchioplanes caeruleus TaxID=56438 RepID=UPI0020C0692E|nr:EAL domain-containing protein [Couchioplanes caeruleus]UQU62237.1 EAL domain-containing protein [Couchioplanes caeruleus]
MAEPGRPGDAPDGDDPVLTHAMMIAALNQILQECGYDPVPDEEPTPSATGDGAADRLIEDARQRADGIVAAALETALRYTDAALDQAARTVQSARRTLAGAPAAPAPVELAPMPAATDLGRTVGETWLAAATAAGVYLPVAGPVAAQTLGVYAACLHDAAHASPADVDAAYRIGLEVVALGIGRPEALPATMAVVLDHLADGDELRPPARQVAGAFAAGFAAALQARTLAQQESLHRATQRAAREFQLALQDSEARYRRLAFYDPVTGLANKSRLVQRLQQAGHGGDPGRHVGVCLIDLGGHAAVCEQFGADAGDHVLAEVARRLQLLARHPDYLLARHGGQTFAVLVQDSGGIAHLAELAERITAALREPASLPGTGLTAGLGAHVGVVDVPTEGLDAGRVLVDAEIAVRQARAGSSGWALYDAQPADTGRGGGTTAVAGLVTRPATYQPIVKLSSGRIAGLHTRMAWRHPHLGTLDLGRIGQLTGDRETTMRLAGSLVDQACRQAMQWDGGKKGPFVGLDLPVHQIGYPDAVELVREALAGSGLPPKRLHLHLSGIDAVPAGAHSHTVLAALAALGVRIVLDDFGTGPSSLAYLRDLPVHGLRTPASLLHDNPASAEADRDLVAGMARMAHALGLTLTVHGVDDELRAATLVGTGCDGAQGLRYGAPTTPHQVPALLRRTGKLVPVPGRVAS